jgi:hypothetical protein
MILSQAFGAGGLSKLIRNEQERFRIKECPTSIDG